MLKDQSEERPNLLLLSVILLAGCLLKVFMAILILNFYIMAQPKTPQHPSATEFSTYLEYLSDSAQPLASQDPTAIQYSTYLDYLGDLINHGFNEYKPLHIYLSYIQSISSPSSRDEVDEYAISVLDLTQIGVRGVRKFRPTVGNSGRSKDFASFKQYIQENDQVMSRLIVLHPSTWFAERYSRGPKIITDSLGLGVGILPWFFHEFCREREERHHHRRPYTIKALPYLESTWVADCNFILLGTHWVLITGHPGTPRSGACQRIVFSFLFTTSATLLIILTSRPDSINL